MSQEPGVSTPAADAPVDVPRGTSTEEPKPAQAESLPAVDTQTKEPKGVGKRIDELTRNWRESQRQVTALTALIERLSSSPPKHEAPVDTEKKLGDFGYDESKYRTYLTEQASRSAIEAARKEAQTWRTEQETAAKRAAFDARAAKFSGEVEDFHEVFTAETPVSQAMAEAMMDTDEGPAIAYYLGKNPDIARKLYGLSAVQAGKEIARIEDRIVAERKKAAEKKVSQAPEPAPQIDGSGSTVLSVKASEPGSDKLTDAEWVKLREKEVRRKRNTAR